MLLNTENLLTESLAQQLTQQQIEEVLNFQQKWQWLGYLIAPLLLLLKISIIAGVLDLGCFIFGKEIKYKKLFAVVVKAEFVFLLVIVCKTSWFYFFKTDYTLEDLQFFYPFSMLSITGYDGLQPWYIYPLQVVNLFEIVYWILLALMLDKLLSTAKDKNTGIKIVASSYGVGLLIWVVVIMFFTLNMS